MTREASFALAAIKEEQRQVVKVKLPPELLIALTQVRKTYQVDEDLIQSFLAHGQIVPGMVAALKASEAQVYVESVNGIFGSKHALKDLAPVTLDGEVYYLIVFAGHRRHRTCLAVKQGIDAGRYEPTACFDGGYRAELHFEITAEEAIALQFNENRYTAPPLHEEADSAWRFYRHKKSRVPELTPGQFAKSIGRTTEWFRNALRFCSLPESVQSYVLGDNPLQLRLPYGSLVELARLAEGQELITGRPLSEDAMHRWIRDAFASQLNVTTFGRKVSEYLEDLRQQESGQLSLFSVDESDAEHSKRIRRTVAKEMIPGLWKLLQYVRTVERARSAGMLGHESYLGLKNSSNELTLFSPQSPIRIVSETVTVVQELMPHLAELARLEKIGYFKRLSKKHPEMAEIGLHLEAFARYEELSAVA